MAPKAVVVDASVAVKWFNAEDFSEQATALRDDHVSGDVVLAAPSLLVWEVCNALRFNPETGSTEVRKALRDLCDLQMVLVGPDPEWMGDAVGEAFEKGVTLYDSSYLALASHLRASFYSADDVLLSKAEAERANHISMYGAE
ncbi:MAG: type II toxin-antitoxin system VapC family toxin [Thermoplasmata archaeon]